MKTQGWQLATAIGLGMSGAIALCFQKQAFAQSVIVPDNTLGAENSQLPTNLQSPTIKIITGGAVREKNLFHSFQEFSIGQEQAAYFLIRSTNIQNVLARVTGSKLSNIEGRLGTLLFVGNQFVPSDANLFLINPNGIIFGANSSLDVGGSFVATTANAIQFGNAGFFSATEPTAPSNLLTIDPSALFYTVLSAQSVGIINRSTITDPNPLIGATTGLQVREGRSLLLVGGDVRLQGGTLQAPGGQIALSGLAKPGRIGLNENDNILSLQLPAEASRANVSVTDSSSVNVSSSGGGNIVINAQDITVAGSKLSAGISLGVGTTDSQAGNVSLNATGEVKLEKSSTILNDIGQNASGVGGKIDIQANSILITGGTQLSASTFGSGKAGGIFLQSVGSLSISDNTTAIFSTVESGANSIDASRKLTKGDGINITAGSFSLADFAQLQTIVREAANGLASGRGDAADITIEVRNGSVTFSGTSQAFSGINSGAVGKGGNITITTRSLSLDSLSSLNAITAGKTEQGVRPDAGTIQLNIADFLSIKGGAQIRSDTFSEGNAGNIIIQADQAGIAIDGVMFPNNVPIVSGIFTTVGRDSVSGTGTGQAGKIQISAQSLALTNSGVISSSIFGKSLEALEADKISLNISESLTLDALANIRSNVEAGGIGKSGDIEVNTRNLTLTNGAQIGAAVFRQIGNIPGGQGMGGNIQINALDSVTLSGVSSVIYPSGVIDPSTSEPFQTEGFSGGLFANTERGAIGTAGNITVNTKVFRITDGAVVNSQTLNSSNGGNITINATILETLNGGQVLTLTRGAGNAGNITINASDRINISGSDPAFPARFAQFGRDVINNEGANSGVFANTDINSSGNGGNISLTTTKLKLSAGGQISSQSQGTGGAGSITANAKSIRLRGNSDILTISSSGDGGNIILNAQTIVALDNSDILAFAPAGKGGTITFNTRAFLSDPLYRPSPSITDRAALFALLSNDRVDVNASGTVSGTVNGVPDITFLQNGLAQLAQNLIDPNTLLANSCIVRNRQQTGRFYITGSGGLPVRPGDAPLSSFSTGDVRSLPEAGDKEQGTGGRRSWKVGDPIVEPQGIYRLSNGNLVLSRECEQ